MRDAQQISRCASRARGEARSFRCPLTLRPVELGRTLGCWRCPFVAWYSDCVSSVTEPRSRNLQWVRCDEYVRVNCGERSHFEAAFSLLIVLIIVSRTSDSSVAQSVLVLISLPHFLSSTPPLSLLLSLSTFPLGRHHTYCSHRTYTR